MKRSLPIVIVVVLLLGCRSKRDVVTRDLPARSAEKISEQVLAAMPNVSHYSAKVDVSVVMDNSTKSSKSQVRMVVDSGLWVSVTPALGIEVARVLMTLDSLKFIDRLKDQYYIGSVENASTRFKMPLDLELLQEALLGAPIGFDPDDKYRPDREDGQYTLTSRERRRFVRMAEELVPEDSLSYGTDDSDRRIERAMRKARELEAVIFKYWIDPDLGVPTRVSLVDLGRNAQMDVRYLSRSDEDGSRLPTRAEIMVNDPTHEIKVTMDISKIRIDGGLSLSFQIPEKYEPLPEP